MPDPMIDKHGDVWTLGLDGLMHTPETAPFPLEYVKKKWGPLRPVETWEPPVEQCAWTTYSNGLTAPSEFCDDEAAEGEPYCAEHGRLADL